MKLDIAWLKYFWKVRICSWDCLRKTEYTTFC